MKAFVLAAVAALTMGVSVANAALPAHSQSTIEKQNFVEGGGG